MGLRAICFVFGLLWVNPFNAQIKKGFEALNQYDFFKARKCFLKSLKKQPAAAHFGLAKIHYDRLNHFHQIDSAYKHVKLSLFALNAASEKQKIKLNSYGVSASNAAVLLDSIQFQAFLRAGKQKQPEGYQFFIAHFGENAYTSKALYLRDSSALSQASAVNTPESYEAFLKDYPETVLKNQALKRLDKIRFELAANQNTLEAYQEFLQKFPESQYKPDAEDGIFKLSVVQGTQDELIRFIRKYPNNRNTLRCWDQFYALYTADQSTERIMEFKERYPDFPFLDKLNRDFGLSKALFFPVVKDELWGYADSSGTIQIPYQFEEAEYFSDNLAVVKKNGKYGYINKSGFVIIPCHFKEAESFEEGLAIAENDTGAGVINTRGMWVIPPAYYSVNRNACRLFRIEQNELYGLMDYQGNLVQAMEFEDIGACSEGRIGFVQDGLAGFMDEQGNIVIKAQYEAATDFLSGISRVVFNEKVGAIRKDGSTLLPTKFKKITPVSEDFLFAEEDKKCLLYTAAGKKVLSLTDRCAAATAGVEGFYNGLARVEKKGKFGFIDKKGKTVIPTLYDQTGVFSEDLCAVRVKGKWGYINKSGKVMVEPQFEQALTFKRKMARVKKNGKWGLIASDGKVLLPFQYEAIEEIQGGFIVELAGKKGFLDETRAERLPTGYQEIKPTPQAHVFELLKDDRLSYYNSFTNQVFWIEEEPVNQP